MKKIWLTLGLLGLLTVLGLTACSPRVIGSAEGQRATVRDAIYSLEPRQNGAYVMWLRYDDEGVYCMTDKGLYDRAMDIMTKGSGWAVIEYHTLRSTELACQNVENTSSKGAQHTIYVVNSISEAENQQ